MSGEIYEYMEHAKNGKYKKEVNNTKCKKEWLHEMQCKIALLGLKGEEDGVFELDIEKKMIKKILGNEELKYKDKIILCKGIMKWRKNKKKG